MRRLDEIMYTPTCLANLLLLLAALPSSSAAETKPEKPCSIHAPTSGSFYDLNPLTRYSLDDDEAKKSSKFNSSYHANGWDYGHNFTINFCAPVVEDLTSVGGVEDLSRSLWSNVSAYYKDSDGNVFSIGQSNYAPVFRGRKLLLNYTGGSLCPELDEDGEPLDQESLSPIHPPPSSQDYGLRTKKREIVGGGDEDDEDDDDDDDKKKKKGGNRDKDDDDDDEDKPRKKPSSGSDRAKTGPRRKNTLMTFICDKDPALTDRPNIAFLGSPDHCTYMFEVRSRLACAGATPTSGTESGTLGPGSVFGLILGIALAVYLIGGVVYQRNVMHQRGWRQLPNYAVWSGIAGFIKDMIVILFSSCTRRMPSLGRLFGGKHAGGYHRVGEDRSNGGFGGRGRGRNRDPEDANRLIDSLDEEWTD